jgi:hypothetical protein
MVVVVTIMMRPLGSRRTLLGRAVVVAAAVRLRPPPPPPPCGCFAAAAAAAALEALWARRPTHQHCVVARR